MKTKVAIVNSGQWGRLRQENGDYDMLVRELRIYLESVRRDGENDEPIFEATVVSNTKEALDWVDDVGAKRAIVYVTRGMLGEAKKVAEEHLKIRVILLTSGIPEGEVVIFPKSGIMQIGAVLLG